MKCQCCSKETQERSYDITTMNGSFELCWACFSRIEKILVLMMGQGRTLGEQIKDALRLVDSLG